MKKFDGVLICTDLDGTLLKKDKSVSKENKEAIEYFKKEGGLFTFVTGRMPYYVDDIYKKTEPNAPFGCINGGGLYDYENKEYLYKELMPRDVLELVEYIDNMFSGIGIQVCTFDRIYFARENDTMEKFRRTTGVKNLVSHYNDVKEPIAKILFGSEDENIISKIKEALFMHKRAEEFDFIQSHRSMYEILPKGIGKGTSIEMLCKKLNIDKNKTIAVGDYNNDISMFKAARIGIAVENACIDAKKAADYVTVSNEESAIAKIIYDLERDKIKF